jgi:hypothetical protein
MSADQLLQWLTQTLFVVVFLVATARAIRRPSRTNADCAILFGATAFVIAQGWVQQAFGISSNRILSITMRSAAR